MNDKEPFRPSPNILRGQRMSETQTIRAQRLRREMTPDETRLWDCLRANRLDGFHFRRQQPIGAYYADFYCHAAGVVVEVDGESHRYQQEYDDLRTEYLSSYGITVLRFTNTEVRENLPWVLESIAQVCKRRRD